MNPDNRVSPYICSFLFQFIQCLNSDVSKRRLKAATLSTHNISNTRQDILQNTHADHDFSSNNLQTLGNMQIVSRFCRQHDVLYRLIGRMARYGSGSSCLAALFIQIALLSLLLAQLING